MVISRTSDGCGDVYCLDLSAVLIGGKVGQIIEYRVRLMRSPQL
ncbi:MULTISPECIES: hypothetical protein [Chroococcidiopsis]|nr:MULTISPECIES: hypothetical protein [Chroococcidiopsis]